MDDTQIRYLGDLQRLTLKPGDRLVLMVDDYISSEIAARLKETLANSVPDDVKVIVLGRGMRLGIIGREDAAHGNGAGAA